MLAEFINTYGMPLMYSAITAIFGGLALILKHYAKEIFEDITKRKIAKDVVKFVEQSFKNLHGDDKLNEALKAASEMLAKKGIIITDLEMRVLIQAALAEFNKVFEKTTKATVTA